MGVITFNDFKGNKKEKSPEIPIEPIVESSVAKEEEKIVEKEVHQDVHEVHHEEISQKIEEITGYKLYRDKQENFSCEIMIEGASSSNSCVRLIIESPEWNLLFNGTMDKNGKCTIPIKKLPILSEGTTGTIKLEVVADDTVFVPWEENFTVKNSKKVMVKVLEQERNDKPSVKVNFK